uniref:MULE transposase domain-containing protein n=1 Tax=Lactuca sativa TaxID=4236 RepID=A0A9R1V6R7_LACSA|nr:hypothetical protein LSAT_V11C600318210 [Lactuca sativa]
MDGADVHQLKNVISEMKEIMHLYLEVFQGLVEQTEAVEKVVPYNVEHVVSDNVEESPEEETVAVNTFGRLTDKTLSDSEESNEGWLEDEFTHGKKASDIFYGMPTIPDCLDLIVEPGPFRSLGPNDDMFFKTKHSNKSRYEVYCEIENCSWRLYAKRLDPTDEFEIRTFNNVHTCSSLQIQPNHKHANKKVMGTILHEVMGKTRSKVWRPNKISRDLIALLEINVDYQHAWRAKQYTMELLLGSSEKSFSKLPIYFHNLKRHNPGTVAYIQTDAEDCFECCFYVIGNTIRAFKHFCRKVIIMDGAHLKRNHIACSSYGWEQPDTVPCARNMKKKSGLLWTWFLEKLYECVGDCQELTFVTDRANAIWVSIQNVFQHAHHGLCAFHLLGNIVHTFRKNDKTKVLFWRFVKAYKRNVFEELWYRFSSTRPQVAAYLSEIPPAKWNRAYSLSKRYDYMTLNSAESMNALSVDARKMPRIPLLEFFPLLLQEWWKRSTVLTEWAEKVVSKNEERTTGWSVSGVSDAIYQVHDFKHGGIEGTGLACVHVIMILKHLKKTNFGHLAIDAYKMGTYRSTYEEPIYPLLELCDWEIPTEMMAVKPPIIDTHQAGRPRNRNRIPSQGEEPIVRRCSRCDSTTHNVATCPTLVLKKQKKATKVVRHQVVTQKGKGKGEKGLRRR